MKLTRKKAFFLCESLQSWQQSGILSEAQVKFLSDQIEIVPFDWRRLARYSIWLALVSLVIAAGSVLADRVLMEFLKRIFNAPEIVKCLGLSFLASGFYWWGVRRKNRSPHKIFTNEAVLFGGVLATAGAVYELGCAMDTGSGHFSILFLLASLLYDTNLESLCVPRRFL